MSIPTYEDKYDAEAVVTPADDVRIYGRDSDTTAPEAVILSFQESSLRKRTKSQKSHVQRMA